MGSIQPQPPKTMKAGQWNPELRKVVVNEIPVPEPGKNEFLVKIRSASLCHSDVLAIQQAEKTVTLGHEGVGHIVSMHPSAEERGFSLGDAVGFLYIRGCCFTCSGCQVHNLHCETGKQLLQGFVVDGFFAEYALVDYHNAIVLDESKWDMDAASAVFCAGITAFHSVDSCELSPGDWFGVVGCGGLGQLATQYAKAMGLKVVGIDVADANLEETRKQGADVVFNSMSNSEWAQDIKELTGGGVQAVAVYTNAPPAFASATSCLALGGTLMIIGVSKEPIKIDGMDLLLGRYKIKADSTSVPQRMQKAVEFTAKHGIMPVVEIRDGLEDLASMVEDMEKGKVAKRQGIAFR
ncbi:alcohol dehydrogenase GroES-like domain-containing protein [Colletotrichum gloeosporioides Cg-14]|uniref:Alcohol dehydrogenase GroES-like domain-containing protein n=1 Tax=Colletotrichum gloeosporioides (strain Cg-14) TaxID=1237896 RepID=T0KJV5_COLGC|nr:alcohol dehydrogenase GroES-like domain-containing protein [Colletotrichum gloeosporioides Cg-14]